MKLFLKFDLNTAYKKILQEQLDKITSDYALVSFGEVDINDSVSAEQLKELYAQLSSYGFDIVESNKSILVQKIKDAIIEMIFMEDDLPATKISSHLANKLNHSYGYLANVFSEVTYTTIENFIILQRIERAKQLLITNQLTLTEIAWKLSYSSVAHLSTQFKNTTGLTPTVFQRIINKRRKIVGEDETEENDAE
jgi:AraC-like DNA-binding protein